MPSVMQRIGVPNRRHNKDKKYREYLENVDPELTQYNETIRNKSVESIYAEKLQPAFEAFNAKQKRKDRRLDVKWEVSTALEYQRKMDEQAKASKNKIGKKGRPPIREIVWQFGNPEQGYGCANQTPEHREFVKGMLLECQEEAERRYPQLAWGDLDFHADEVSQDANDEEHGSLHLHSSFVPLCLKNKQGPDVQVAFERCLEEMGFSSFEAWKHDLDNIMEDVLRRHGLERTVMDNYEAHRDSKEFHRQQRLLRETKAIEAQKAQAEQQAKELQEQLGVVQEELEDQQQLYARNDAVIAAQEEALNLIQTVEEYEDKAVEILDQIDVATSAAQELPAASRLFKRSEGATFVHRMLDVLETFRELIRSGIARLRIYELTYGVPEHLQEPLSEPVQRHADTLDVTIANARSQEANEGSGDRQRAREEEFIQL